MDLRVLRYFLATVDEGSITAAARRVHVAQPSLSRQLRALESELGVALFHREGRAIKLSPAGRRFLPIVRDLVARADSARAAMTALGRGAQVELTIAAHPTTIADVIAPFVAEQGERLTVPTFVAASADDAYRFLDLAQVDVAVSANVPPRTLASVELARFPIWAQVPETHRWAAHDAVPLDALLTQRLIVLDSTHGTRRTFDDVVGAARTSYEIGAEVSVPRIAQALAAAGQGVAILTDDPTYGLRRLRIEGSGGSLQITLHAAWNTTHYAADSIRSLVDSLADYCSRIGLAPTDERSGGTSPEYSATLSTAEPRGPVRP